MVYLFKTPPSTSKNAITTTKEAIKCPNCVFIQNAPTPASNEVVPNFVFIKNAPRLFQIKAFRHKGAHKMTNFCIYSKPPLLQKKRYHIVYLFKTHPTYLKKSGYYHQA